MQKIRPTQKQLDLIVEAATSQHSDSKAVEAINATEVDLGAQGPPPKRATRKSTADTYLKLAEKLIAHIGADPLSVYEPDVDRQERHVKAACALQAVTAVLCSAYGG